MHKKTNYLIPAFILCFSIIFLFFPSQSLATDYTILGPGDTASPGTIMVPISELGSYDVVDDSFGPESTVGEYVWITPISTGTTSTGSKRDKWSCGGGCNGVTLTCSKSRTGYKTKAQCEACCPCGFNKVCRWYETKNQFYCATASSPWCEVNPGNECEKNADCNNGTSSPEPIRYSCNTSTWTCEEISNGVYSSLATCQSNCVKPGVEPPPEPEYGPLVKGWKCWDIGVTPGYVRKSKIELSPNFFTFQDVGTCDPSPEDAYFDFCKKCVYAGWTNSTGLYSTKEECEAANNCKYKCKCMPGRELTTGTAYPVCSCEKCGPGEPCEKECSTQSDCIGVPPASSLAPKCQIFEFSINGKTNEDRDPLFVWVNASLKGYISVNDSCTECTVTSDDVWGNPPKDYTITSISTYITESFKIPLSGTYFFELYCIGDPADPDDFDEDATSLKAVEALNLPWWQEIIPVLQGFLGGAWR